MSIENEGQEKLSLSRVKENMGAAELQCDVCGKHLGYVDENDLNGTYFFCDECVNNHKE
jgi:hypothetical protein